MTKIRSICVYCGSSNRVEEQLLQAAGEFGRRCAERGIRVIFGGGRVGMMGRVADAAMSRGGEVVGIIPEHLDSYEIGHRGVTDLEIVDSMHSRKMRMFELSDAFCILPGGLGTLDETFEILTWRQIGLHDKPLVLVDLAGYWQPLRALIAHQVAQGYLRREHADLMQIVAEVGQVLPALRAAPGPRVPSTPERL